METTIQETDTMEVPFAFGSQPQTQVLKTSKDEPQTYYQCIYETPWKKLESAMRNGNTQDRINALEEFYKWEDYRRSRICIRKLSRIQLLNLVQCFLARKGLVLGKGVRSAYLHKSRHN